MSFVIPSESHAPSVVEWVEESLAVSSQEPENDERCLDSARHDKSLHLFRHFDPQKIETALQHSPAEIAQCQTRTARRLWRFQDGTGFIKCVKAVRQPKQIICQNVRAKIVQYLWDDFHKLTETFCEIDFSGIIEG